MEGHIQSTAGDPLRKEEGNYTYSLRMLDINFLLTLLKSFLSSYNYSRYLYCMHKLLGLWDMLSKWMALCMWFYDIC